MLKKIIAGIVAMLPFNSLKKTIYSLLGAKIGKFTVIYPNTVFGLGFKKMTIGKNVEIKYNSVFDCKHLEIGSDSIIENNANMRGNRLKIGKNVYIAPNCLIECNDSVTIDDGCDIGPNVTISTSDSSKANVTGYGKIKEEPVYIEKNVYIGSNAVILPGISIGEKSVIGAGAVVTKNVPAKSVMAGVPAKKIKNADIKFNQKELEQNAIEALQEFTEEKKIKFTPFETSGKIVLLKELNRENINLISASVVVCGKKTVDAGKNFLILELENFKRTGRRTKFSNQVERALKERKIRFY